MKTIAFIYAFFCVSTIAVSQTDDQDLRAMFDDGNMSNAKTVFKVNPTGLVAGDFPVHLERAISQTVSIELGLGYLIDMNRYELYVPLEFPQDSLGNGYSLWVNPRAYVGGDAPEGYFFGLMYRRRNFSSGQINNDWVLNSGIQLSTGKGRLVWEVMYGSGIRFIRNPIEQSNPYYSVISQLKFIFPASIKIGYKF